MKNVLIIISLLFSMTMYSQIQVKIANHTIEVEDTLMESTLKKYEFYMEKNPINYEDAIEDIRQIKTVKADRYYVGEFNDGIIFLNERLNDFPYSKRAVILYYVARNNGMKVQNRSNAHVTSSNLNITDYNEDNFRKQFARDTPYKYIVTKLKEQSPLRSELR